MITRMLYDLLFFISIMSVTILAYGVATEGVIFPTGKDDGILQLWNIVWRPYIHLFGELDLDSLDNQLGMIVTVRFPLSNKFSCVSRSYFITPSFSALKIYNYTSFSQTNSAQNAIKA